MSKFNTRTSVKTTNLAGGRAYTRNPEEELVFAVLSTFLEDKYYESGEDRQARIVNLISQVDPKFVANLAIVARNEYYLRSVSHLLLAELSLIDNQYTREAVIASVIRPDDITEIISYLDGKLSNQMKRGLRRSLYKFDRYQLAKYRGKKNKVSLADAFNLLHPNPNFATDEQKSAWEDLINGDLKMEATLETGIKNLPELIRQGRLGYMAMLRNLNNLKDSQVKHKVIEVLTDPERIRKSKQLPFRFYTAYMNVEDVQFRDAVVDAFEKSILNMPKFVGKTLVAIDGSGSMYGRPIQIASVLAASLLKSNYADVVIYDTSVKEFKYSTRSMALDIADRIQQEANGGGTNTGAVFEYAHQNGLDYDRIIIVSDNESWDTGIYGDVIEAYQTYRQNTKKDPYIYAIDVAGYGTKDIDSEKVFHFAGWSEKIFDFIKMAENKQNITNYVKNYEISKTSSVYR